MKALSIGWSNIVRMLRERSNIFFVFIFPLALVLLIGVQFGAGFEPRVGLFNGDGSPLAEDVAQVLMSNDEIVVVEFHSEDELTTAVERGQVQIGAFLPAGFDSGARSGTPVEVDVISRPDGFGAQLQQVVSAAVAEVMGPVGAGQFAVAELDVEFDDALATSRSLAGEAGGIEVSASTVGEAIFPSTLGQFDLGASSQLVLFTFLTAMAGASALILTRQLGISRRMMSTPTPMKSIVAGEALGRFGTAILQGLYIMVLTLIIFSVNWGDPLGALLILIALSAVGAGAGMLLGSLFKNDQQASGIGVMLSLGLGALGGAMFPLDLFPDTLRTIAHVTPHAWALDGFAELVRRGGTTLDILPQLGVLVLYAVVLLVLAAWRLRVAIIRP